MRLTPRSLTSRTLAAVLGTLALTVAAAAPGGATGRATRFYEKVDGYLQAYPGDCPPADAPQDPLVCHEVVLSAWRVGSSDTSVAPPKASWVLDVVRHTLTFPGGGADPTESDVVEGFSVDPVVTFDQQHLSSAHLTAANVAMSDGTTLEVDATWVATSDRMLFGNDGPSLEEFGRVRHFHDVCVNEVNQGHQKFRLAHVHALLNGVPSDDNSIFAFLAYNHFISIEVHPASCN